MSSPCVRHATCPSIFHSCHFLSPLLCLFIACFVELFFSTLGLLSTYTPSADPPAFTCLHIWGQCSSLNRHANAVGRGPLSVELRVDEPQLVLDHSGRSTRRLQRDGIQTECVPLDVEAVHEVTPSTPPKKVDSELLATARTSPSKTTPTKRHHTTTPLSRSSILFSKKKDILAQVGNQTLSLIFRCSRKPRQGPV